jgi:copper chaperone
MRFEVQGMSCGHCVATVEDAIAGAANGVSANIDLDAKTVEVNGSISARRRRRPSRRPGYDVQRRLD